MKKNIVIAFVLNLVFSFFEMVGGLITGSTAILSDAVHDLGDAASIGVSCLLERKSHRPPDKAYTYGYSRYRILGSLVSTSILLVGSVAVIGRAVSKLLHPTPIHNNGMIFIAIIGAVVNFAAAWFTRGGNSINQKAVNLHMLEDVLGWLVVLIGAIVMRFTDWIWLDPLLSLAVVLFILLQAIRHMRHTLVLLLDKAPAQLSGDRIAESLCRLEGVEQVHHIHVRSLDECTLCASMHIVTRADPATVKKQVRQQLQQMDITHAVLELELPSESCSYPLCHIPQAPPHHEHHHPSG